MSIISQFEEPGQSQEKLNTAQGGVCGRTLDR